MPNTGTRTATAGTTHNVDLTFVEGGFVAASPLITNATVDDQITFRSTNGHPLRIVFLNGKSPFKAARGALTRFMASDAAHRQCELEGSFSFVCELEQDGEWVTYQVGNAGGDVNVGGKGTH
jgi:hypothetical protein